MAAFLGIDGGGSKTSFLLEDDGGQQLARFQTGPSNWISAGKEAASQCISEGIRRLPFPPDVVCGGFAGAGRPEGLEFYRRCLSDGLPGARILIETDAFIGHIGALGMRPGVLLTVGTGSIATGRRHDGSMIRVGGWGPVFGDEGSGHWIGREAIRTALRANDAGDHTDFVTAVSAALGVGTVHDIVGHWNVSWVASVAETVFRLYPSPPAKRILQEAASHLRAIVGTAMTLIGVEDCPRAIAGSIGKQPLMQELIGLDFVAPQRTPEQGAIQWARSLNNSRKEPQTTDIADI